MVSKNLILSGGVAVIAATFICAAVLFVYRPTVVPVKTPNHTLKLHAAVKKELEPQKGFDKSHYSTSDPTSTWVIVNKQHPIQPLGYAPSDLITVGNGQQLRAEAASALNRMFAAAKAAGYSLTPDSGYRSYSTQVSTYNGYIAKYGQIYTDTVSARPGYSEHQTGWAIDIGTDGCHVDDCFGRTPGGKWASVNAYEYGFILRYPDSLTPITGYSHEAWHFRYIGTDLANELHSQNILTLEQFFNISGGTNYAK